MTDTSKSQTRTPALELLSDEEDRQVTELHRGMMERRGLDPTSLRPSDEEIKKRIKRHKERYRKFNH